MLKKFIRYSKKFGLRKALSRSFHEIGKIIDPDVARSESAVSPYPMLTSSVHILTVFKESVQKIENAKILELGSRAVTPDSLHDMLDLHSFHEYTGLDIHDGPNVDIVGDVHELSLFLPKYYYDAVMSKAVFEHIAMPWKAILEINAVLKQNGLLFINTHQTFPLHEKPWDFWRFSEDVWRVLLNRCTGFEIIEAGLEFPCRILPWVTVKGFSEIHEAYLGSTVLARKIGPYDKDLLKWDLGIKDILQSNYPKY